VLAPTFFGAIMATITDSLGYSFLSGAGEALMHDTLVAMGRVGDYIKVMGRAQSYGLIGNIVLISLVPMTYAIDKRLPFICGTVAVLCFIGVVGSLREPPRESLGAGVGLRRTMRAFVTRRTVLWFLAFGLISAQFTAQAPFNNLIFQDLGMPPALLGLVFGLGSLAGAVAGWLVHYLKRLSLLQFSLADVAIGCSSLVVIGVAHNLLVSIVVFFINMGFWRVRGIVYQDQLLRRFREHGHKATLVSTMAVFQDIFELWLPAVFVAAIGSYGLYGGFTVMGVGLGLTCTVLFVLAARLLNAGPALTEGAQISKV
jgi:hypothetical protein